MPSRKTKNRKLAAPTTLENNNKGLASGFFPFASYVSIVGVHTTLLGFVALFLARAPQAFPRSSSPPSPFLEGLTRDPVSTLTWICAGAIPLQGWWAGWVSKWLTEFSMKETDTKKRLDGNMLDNNKIPVSLACNSIHKA
jgi:GPI ethanolamine phosphate transferase 2/3 subunit F